MSRARLIDHAMTTDPIDAQVFEKPPPVIITYSVVVRGSCGPRVGARWAIERRRYTRCTRTRFAIAYAFCASHMHYFAMVYATAIRVCTRVYSFSLPLSPPTHLRSHLRSLSRSRSLLHSLGAQCMHVSRVAEGRVQEGARRGEMGGREKRMRWERWLAKGAEGRGPC